MGAFDCLCDILYLHYHDSLVKISRPLMQLGNQISTFSARLVEVLLTLFDPGGRDLPPACKIACTCEKSMGGNSDIFLHISNVCQVRSKPIFMVKKLSVWFGDHKVGQKRLIFIRGNLTNDAKVASEH